MPAGPGVLVFVEMRFRSLLGVWVWVWDSAAETSGFADPDALVVVVAAAVRVTGLAATLPDRACGYSV